MTQNLCRNIRNNDVPPLEGAVADQAIEDMAVIIRGEELDITWRRLRLLIDHGLMEIVNPVILGGSLRGSRTTLRWTPKGVSFMKQ